MNEVIESKVDAKVSAIINNEAEPYVPVSADKKDAGVNENDNTDVDKNVDAKIDFLENVSFDENRYEVVSDIDGLDDCIFIRSKDKKEWILINIKDDSYWHGSMDGTIAKEVHRNFTSWWKNEQVSYDQIFEAKFLTWEMALLYDAGKVNEGVIKTLKAK